MYLFGESPMNNPLVAAYRKPALYVTLPSGGKFYNPKPKLSVDGEIAVYPMTARDELVYKTPDALFNGEATFSVIKSCVPDIPDPNQMPINDLVVLLLAIRQATNGKNLDVDIRCPECDNINMLTVDANHILATAKPMDTDTALTWPNGFVIQVKPYNLEDRTLLQIQQVKQRKMLQALTDETIGEEERTRMFGKTFVDLAELTIDLISNCIVSVKIDEDTVVDNREQIKEWLQSITKEDYDQIRDRVEQLSGDSLDTNMNATCQECSHTWQTKLDLDVANFFVG